VTALCSNLGVAESNRAQRQRPQDIKAWALCVQAEVLYFTQPDRKGFLEAERLARRAADIEPGYAVSWALLGLMASSRMIWGLSVDLIKDAGEALLMASKALRLAPNDPTVLGYCGYAATWAGQAPQAIDYLQRSLIINPNSNSRLYYAGALWVDARPEEGIAQLEIFIRRSPKDPYIGVAYLYLAWCYLSLKDFQQAEQSARTCIKHLPGFAWGYLLLAMSLSALGREDEARQKIEQVHTLERALTRQKVEDFWNHMLRKPGQAEMFIALLRHVWSD